MIFISLLINCRYYFWLRDFALMSLNFSSCHFVFASEKGVGNV